MQATAGGTGESMVPISQNGRIGLCRFKNSMSEKIGWKAGIWGVGGDVGFMGPSRKGADVCPYLS